MANSFFADSKTIANDFIQNIVFVDDEAYKHKTSGERDHELDPFAITKVFANSHKICSIYNPESKLDVDNVIKVSQKADVVVLDWRIYLRHENSAAIDENEDADNDDPRGVYTLEIIKNILTVDVIKGNAIKLIAVYTGEIDLKGIADTIYETLINDVEGLQKTDFEIFTKNIKVVLIGKPSLSAKHLPEIEARIIQYSELPDFLLTEFAKMTSGLISNAILVALTTIRRNTYRLINSFNKDIDSAFLSHRVLLPNQNDSKDYLLELLSHSILWTLQYNHVGESLSVDAIDKWIDSQTFDKNIVWSNTTIAIDANFIKKWIRSDFLTTFKQSLADLGYGEISQTKLRELEKLDKYLYKDLTGYFSAEVGNRSGDYRFSILTHQKGNIEFPQIEPKLTLGTIIKGWAGDNVEYYVCIQQKCDSVRIQGERRFLFLPLISVEEHKSFNFVIVDTEGYVRLKVDFNSHNLKTIKFTPRSGSDKIIAENTDEGYLFLSVYGERYLWISDLYDTHAQRIANAYASQLSRVGLDESEWLRRSN